MDDPGGGSDFAGFYNHLGIPISEWGYGGPGGELPLAVRFVSLDGDVRRSDVRLSRRVRSRGAAMVLRLANAEILPYDYVEFARDMRIHMGTTQKNAVDKHWTLERLGARRRRSMDSSTRPMNFNAARDSVLAKGSPSKAVSARTNASLMLVERALTRPQGLKTRPWFRNLIYAADEDNGYSNMVFPSINEATRAGDQQLAQTEMNDLATRFTNATDALNKATAALR